MELIKPGINIDFIGKRKLAFSLSIILIIATVFLLILRGGPNLGVDFTGGILVQTKFSAGHSPAEIKQALSSINLQDSIIQEFGEKDDFEYLIRVRESGEETGGLSDALKDALSDHFGETVEIRRDEMVGPKVGESLREKALFAIFFSILFMAIYISGRFELKWFISFVMAISLAVVVYVASLLNISITWLIVVALLVTIILCWVLKLKYAMGAIIALIHDVTITLGAFALTNREISLEIIAALLTIVGYSLNDTIVVFDRIRENLRRFRKKNMEEVINSSINETISRTVLTSLTTLIVVIVLFIFGGGVIHDFAFAMLVGVVVGTYSSVFLASPIILMLESRINKKARSD